MEWNQSREVAMHCLCDFVRQRQCDARPPHHCIEYVSFQKAKDKHTHAHTFSYRKTLEQYAQMSCGI